MSASILFTDSNCMTSTVTASIDCSCLHTFDYSAVLTGLIDPRAAFLPAFIGSPGPAEMLIVGVVALLLFGKRLPEVARNLGKGFSEFKKGMSGFQEEIRSASRDADRKISYDNQPSSASKTTTTTAERPAPAPESVQADDEFAAPKFNAD